MTLDSQTIHRIYDDWAKRQPDDAPVFGGPDGNLFFADDSEFWERIDLAYEAERLLLP